MLVKLSQCFFNYMQNSERHEWLDSVHLPRTQKALILPNKEQDTDIKLASFSMQECCLADVLVFLRLLPSDDPLAVEMLLYAN